MTRIRIMLSDDAGAAVVEYALMGAMLSVIMIAALTAIATECKTRLGVTTGKMTALGTTPP
jgi:Flp pilus assembly pilin Flp